MPYPAIAFTSILIFIFVHLWAEKAHQFNIIKSNTFLSISSGIPIAYVFVDLLPKLCKKNIIVQNSLSEVFPYVERHAFVIALAGFLLFFIVGRSHTILQKKESLWLSLGSYALFNFFIGYAVVNKDDPEVQPLALFTLAIALLYFINDYNFNRTHSKEYHQFGKWVLILSLLLGWLVGIWIVLPEAGVALISAFIGGGVIMNVMLHELSQENNHSVSAFIVAASIYTVILLSIGS